MSEDTEPKPTGEQNPDAAAKDAAKDLAKNAGNFFKALDQKHKIYLIALGVTLICSIFFGAYAVKVTSSGGLGNLAESMMKSSGGGTSPALLSLGSGKGAFGGKLAFVGALAGIGVLIWSATAKRKDSWIPLALAGAAGVATLGILITRLGMTGGESNEFMKISIDGTLLGWWLPLAGAVTATVVSVQRIIKA